MRSCDLQYPAYYTVESCHLGWLSASFCSWPASPHPQHTHTPMLFQAWPLMTRDCWLILACAKLCSRLVMWTGVEGLEWAHWTLFTCCLRYSPAWAGKVGTSASRADRVSRLNTTPSSGPQQAGDGGGGGLLIMALGRARAFWVIRSFPLSSFLPLLHSCTLPPLPALNFPSENVRMVEQWSGQKWNFVNKQPPHETLEHRLKLLKVACLLGTHMNFPTEFKDMRQASLPFFLSLFLSVLREVVSGDMLHSAVVQFSVGRQ